MMASRGMGAIAASKMPKKKEITRTDDPNKVAMYKRGGQVKKYNGEDESLVDESPRMSDIPEKDVVSVNPNAYKNDQYQRAGLGVRAGNFSADVGLGKSKAGLNQEKYSNPETRLSYRMPIEEGGIGASKTKSGKMDIKDVTGDMPLGKGHLSGRMSETSYDGHKVGKSRDIGYSYPIGEGRLSAGISKQEGGPYSGQVMYRMPFAKGGEVWDKPRPKDLGKPQKLSPAKKASAKASAKRAGRPYPNLVDNMRAAKANKGTKK